jgi:hypothetical protein
MKRSQGRSAKTKRSLEAERKKIGSEAGESVAALN